MAKKANEALLGSVGEKKKPAGSKNYFQKIQDAPKNLYDVTVSGHVTIETESANEWGMSASSGNVAGEGGGSGNYKGKVTAYKVSIDLGNKKGDLRYETNRRLSHLNALEALGNKGRMISAVWFLVKGKEDKSSCYSGKLDVSGATFKIGVNAAGCKSSSYTIPAGSIIAYEMVKVSKWSKDELTHTPRCPTGYGQYDVRSSSLNPKDRCEKKSEKDTGVRCKLGKLDKRKNWEVSSRKKRDTCKSKKGKKDKEVECVNKKDRYVVQEGKDKCVEETLSYKDPTCDAGYDYDKKSTGNKGKDVCQRKGITKLKVDSQNGF